MESAIRHPGELAIGLDSARVTGMLLLPVAFDADPDVYSAGRYRRWRHSTRGMCVDERDGCSWLFVAVLQLRFCAAAGHGTAPIASLRAGVEVRTTGRKLFGKLPYSPPKYLKPKGLPRGRRGQSCATFTKVAGNII